MRIVLDMQGAQSASRLRGIGRHTLNLAKAIVRHKGEHEVILALNGAFQESIPFMRKEFEALLSQDKINVWYPLANTDYLNKNNKTRREISECLYELFLESLEPDVVHIFSHFEGYIDNCITSIKKHSNYFTSITLYDLIPYIKPELLEKKNAKEWYFDKFNNAKNADIFLAISNSTISEGINHLERNAKDFYMISSGCTDIFEKQIVEHNETPLETFNIEKEFLFYTGGLDEHKNINNLITAYSKLDKKIKEKHQLIISCGSHHSLSYVLRDFTTKCGLNENEVIFLPFLSDYDLQSLYTKCKLFIFPSTHEGFGLPSLEAMQCGAAVIASDATSIPEVIGFERALFDPYNIDSIKTKIEEVLNDEDFRQQLIAHAKEQVKKFSWNNSAKIAIQAFEKNIFSNNKSITNKQKYFDLAISTLNQKIKLNISELELCHLARCVNLNFPITKDKTIFVDISELYQNDAKTGVQRVTRSIMQELLINPPKGYTIEAVYATNSENGYYYAKKNIDKIFALQRSDENNNPIIFQQGDIFFGLDLQCHTTVAQNDFLKFMNNHGVKIKFLIHDLLPLITPEVFPKGAKEIHSDFHQTIAQFDGTICVSNTVNEELKQWHKKNDIKVKTSFSYGYSHNGSDLENSVPTKGLPQDYENIINKIKSKLSILMVSTIEPRKGYAQALEAVEQLWAKDIDINLVIVGKQGWDVEALINKINTHGELDNRLFWLNAISDEYLDMIYQASTVVLMASSGEGFGLALIEAARHNIPLIARDLPVFIEIAGKHAYYFSGYNPEDLSQAIVSWLELYKREEAPSTKEMPILTWKESTNNLLTCLLD